MNKQKILFLDRDGTLIVEPPETKQVNSISEMVFVKNVISSLKRLSENGFKMVIVTNQDGLGTAKNPRENYDEINKKMFEIFESEGVKFSAIFECPDYPEDNCTCRKPKIGMLKKWLSENEFDKKNSYMVGDRQTDVEFAENLNIKGFLLGYDQTWQDITKAILEKPRVAVIRRETKETSIYVKLNLDGVGRYKIETGLKFFNHMLEQLSKHSSFDIEISCKGDLEIDEHHTIEDVAIALGEAFKEALGDKIGIERFGFSRIHVMDEAKVEVAIDLSGRSVFTFIGEFRREKVGDFPCEMTKHFFESFSIASGTNAYISVLGDNEHHKIEACFKAFAKTLKDAVKKTGTGISSTKGAL